jgi:hypothetical protein
MPVKRSLFIGLGGTGRDAVLSIKRKLLEVYGAVPRSTGFLVLDTDDPVSARDRFGNPVELGRTEFMHLEVRDPFGLIRSTGEVSCWWPEGMRARIILHGAGGFRPLGRLALFANAQAVHQSLSNLINHAKDPAVENDPHFSVEGTDVNVNIIGSIAGGTGAGTLLDVAMICRDLLGTSGDSIFGWVLLPDVFTPLPGVNNNLRNAYATLMELDYLQSIDFERGMRYQFAGHEIEVKSPPFDAVLLVNNCNRMGATHNLVRDLTEFVGLGAYLSIGSMGAAHATVFDNVKSYEANADAWFGKDLSYCSFGLSELFFDRQRYAGAIANKIARMVAEQVFFTAGEEDQNKAARDFVEANQIRQGNADEVIDYFILPMDFRKMPLPNEYRPELVKSLFARRDTYLLAVDAEVDAKVSERAAALRARTLDALSTYIDARLGQPGGFLSAQRFLDNLSGVLNAYREEMAEEAQQLENELRSMGNRRTQLEAELAEASGRMLGRANALERVARNFKRTVEEEANLKLEIRRRQEATALFAALVGSANNTRGRLDLISEHAGQAVTDLSATYETLLAGPRPKPFVMQLEPQGMLDRPVEVSTAEFLGWLQNQGLSVIDLGSLQSSDFRLRLESFAGEQEAVRRVLDLSVDAVLAQLPEAEQIVLVEKLNRMAVPLWQYDTGVVAGERHTDYLVVVGLPDADNSALTPELVRKGVAVAYEPSRVSTGDRDRIVWLTVEMSLPGFVVMNTPRYREAYEAIDQVRKGWYHLSKEWTKLVPSLFPKAMDAESSKYWSIALASPYRLITNIGSDYYLHSEKYGDQVSLGVGREKAYRNFVENQKFVDEVRTIVERTTRSMGEQDVAARLRDYAGILQTRAQQSGDADAGRIEQELRDILEFAQDLESH